MENLHEMMFNREPFDTSHRTLTSSLQFNCELRSVGDTATNEKQTLRKDRLNTQ